MPRKIQKDSSLDNVRHSFAHVLAAAVKKLYPKAELGIGPVIENGFYYDFGNVKISDENLPKIEKEMRKIIQGKHTFKKELWTAIKVRNFYKKEKQPFKLDLIKELGKGGKKVGMVHTGDVFLDLCRGGHVKNTSELPIDAFKLTHVAGAYWRGDEQNPMLTRVYGAAFATSKELDEYIEMVEEAKRRDHKKLGRTLDLFTFSDLVGAGLPLWTPKGTVMRNILDSYVWELRKKQGYEMVDIPHITKKDLYEISGHWEKFKDELFKIETREGHLFAMKPMNCPHHIQIYDRRRWSYRELPQRYASTTKVYRDEQTGELAGLARVRAITQDDAHVFCRNDQVEEEFLKIWDIITTFYSAIGFDLTVRLSLHDPKKPKNYLGNPKLWKQAENALRNIAKKKKVSATEALGEAAFYGPKVDFIAKDSLGREWQVATIQLDINLPERFDLNCIDEEGKQERIVMIHAAIMGSIERFFSILIEHYAGAFPFWLAPEQVRIVPISEKFVKYAESVQEELLKENEELRVTISDANETLGKRIREGETLKIPYLLIVGEKEKEAHSVSIREHGKKDGGAMSIAAFLEIIKPIATPPKK